MRGAGKVYTNPGKGSSSARCRGFDGPKSGNRGKTGGNEMRWSEERRQAREVSTKSKCQAHAQSRRVLVCDLAAVHRQRMDTRIVKRQQKTARTPKGQRKDCGLLHAHGLIMSFQWFACSQIGCPM